MPETTEGAVKYLQEAIEGVSVVIPCKNEEAAIRPTVEQVRQHLEPTGMNYEIIVVNDGSSDSSGREALEAGAMVLVHRTNLGYGNAIMNGMSMAKYDVIAILDADGTYPIAELPAMVEMAQGYDMVVGQRIWQEANTTFISRVLRKLLAMLIYYFSSIKAPDFNSGFRVFHKLDILNYRPFLCPTFSFTTSQTLLFLLTHRSVFFKPIKYDIRIGKTKVSLVRDAFRTFSYVLLMTNLFQPYRLSGVFLLVGLLGNLLVWLGALALGWSGGTQLALHLGVSLSVICAMLALVIMPLTKIILRVFKS